MRALANECLYVSGQPSRTAYHVLVSGGMKAIVNLRAESEMRKRQDVWRRENRMFSVPISDEGAPTAEQAEEFLRLAADRENWPLLVHCKWGDGRAATMAALVRYSFDGWDIDRCLEEAYRQRRWRFFVWLGLRPRLPGSQEAFLRQWARSHPPGARRPRRVRQWEGLRFSSAAPHAHEMLQLWQAMPARVRRHPLLVFEVPVAEWSGKQSWAGYYSKGEIYVRRECWQPMWFYREVGHAVWYEIMTGVQRRDWERFWARNLKRMPGDYARTNACEGHAECFALSLTPAPPARMKTLDRPVRDRVLSYVS